LDQGTFAFCSVVKSARIELCYSCLLRLEVPARIYLHDLRIITFNMAGRPYPLNECSY